MSVQYETNEEQTLHYAVIHSLANHYQVEESAVREIYETKLEELKKTARINTFLPVLIERHIKNYIQATQASA